MKTSTLLTFALLYGAAGISQNSYTFSKLESQLYSELAGDTTVPVFDANGLYVLNDFNGETFKLYNLDFKFGGLKTIAIGEYPFLRIDNDSSLIIADVAFTYADTIDASTRISYRIDGVPGSRTLTVQYKNFSLRYGQPGNFINVQISYAQLSGIIELRYGPRSASNASGFNPINGPQIGIFYSPDDFSGCYEKLWCEGAPTNVVLDSLPNYDFTAMNGIPPEGTVYRFTPRFMQPPPPPPPTNTTSIETENTMQILTYPSPADKWLSVNGTEQGETIRVFDIQGTLISELVGNETKTVLPCAEWPEGIYFLWMKKRDVVSLRRFAVAHY